MARPRKVKPKDRLLASDWNNLVDAIAKEVLGRMGGLLGGTMGVLGTPQSIPPPQLRLVEAYDRAAKSSQQNDDEFNNGGQVWSVECKFVKIETGQSGYQRDEAEDTLFVYFPTQYRKLEGGGEQGTVDYPPVWHQTSHEGVKAGSRFWVIHNAATGRWEYMGPANQLIRFRLAEALASGGSALAQTMWSHAGTDAPSAGEQIRVYDWQGGSSAAALDTGYAVWFPDLGRWETVFVEGSQSTTIAYIKVGLGTSNPGVQAINAGTTLEVAWSNDFTVNTDTSVFEQDGADPNYPNITCKVSGYYRVFYKIMASKQTTAIGDEVLSVASQVIRDRGGVDAALDQGTDAMDIWHSETLGTIRRSVVGETAAELVAGDKLRIDLSMASGPSRDTLLQTGEFCVMLLKRT